MDTNAKKHNNGFQTPPVHSTETGRQYVRPIDILRSEKGREQIRLLRQAKFAEGPIAQVKNTVSSKS